MAIEPRWTMRTRAANDSIPTTTSSRGCACITISKTAPADIADHLTPVAIAHWFADMGGVGDGASLVGEGHEAGRRRGVQG